MLTDPLVFRDLAYVFVAAVAGGALARLAGQPLVIGYVVGGILIGPFTPGPAVSDLHTFEVFAEIGVVLLMFSIGVEFSLRDLLRVRWVALLGGALGIMLSVALAAAVWVVLAWPVLQGVVVGLVISVASSMVLIRLLLDRGELRSRHGRLLVALSLVEDLAVVIMIVVMPTLGVLHGDRVLAVGLALAKSAAILLPFGYLAAKVVPRLLTQVARTHSAELFLLVALAVAVGAAALSQALGLSLALGAFLAGLILSDSDYAHETLARLLPLRDVFVAFFFVTLGALIDPSPLVASRGLLAVLVGLIVPGKLLVRAAVVRAFGYDRDTAILVGVGLAQIGEFSFVLAQVARASGYVGADVYNATLAAALLSLLVNAYLMGRVPRWLARGRTMAPMPPAESSHATHVVVCGFGRVGSAIGEALETFGVPYAVVESDIDIVKGLRARGVPCVFGDAAHRRVLERAGAAEARLLVVALPEIEHARLAVRQLRALNPSAPILARAHRREAVDELRAAGVSEVIQPEMEAAATLVRHALQRLSLPREGVLAYLSRLRRAMDAEPDPAAAEAGPLPSLREIRIGRGALADQSLGEARVRERFGVTIVAVRREGKEVHNPGAETRLRAGDQVTVFGLPEQIEAFRDTAERQ
jgi:CPA2 family monovalent cation:H+ antiporter-2